jgi:geranylgeranyl diphosphate synthase type II
MDQAPIRRGKETVHIKYDNNTAILSGDVMLVWAYAYLAKNHPKALPELLALFNKTAMEVCEGQQIDLLFEKSMPDIDAYIEMISLKTAVLLGAALQIGALLAEADESDSEHIYAFGKYTGIAFQLLDDILDTFGTAENFGKKIGGDIVQNKKTILLLSALQHASASQAEELHYWLNNHTDEEKKINAMTRLFVETGAEQEARNLVQHYHRKALAHLHAIKVDSVKKALLLEFSEMLLQRTT